MMQVFLGYVTSNPQTSHAMHVIIYNSIKPKGLAQPVTLQVVANFAGHLASSMQAGASLNPPG